jgi:Tol biopolymer transport system component
MALTSGTHFGTYEIISPLGEGGMGEVWRARDTELEREVAIKVLPESFVSDGSRIARFEQEAKTLAALNHNNIAQVFGIERQEGQTAIVMELVEGPTLADRIEQGPLPADEALNIAMQIASALEAAHERHIIHRDLKPANIKLRPDGTVKVLDFGIAKAVDFEALSSGPEAPVMTTPVTLAGTILGTAAYMSPEQARGRPIDQRTDIWAFGVVLFEMLTGQPAFAGEDVTVTLARVLERDTNLDTLPRGIAPAVRHTIRLCLEKDVRKRIRHIGDVQLGLQGLLEAAQGEDASSASSVPASRLATVAAIAAVLAVAITAVVSFSLWPEPASQRVSRFELRLASGYVYRRAGRRMIDIASDGSAFVQNTSRGLVIRRFDDVEPELIEGTEEDLVGVYFSADSREVAYWGADGDLYRVAVSGGSSPVPIVQDIDNPFGVSWGADNMLLIGQERGIVRVPASGGDPELLIEAGDGEIYFGPRLLPDGDTVLFGISSTEDPVDGEIVAQSLSTGARKVLIANGNDARYVASGHLVYALGDALFGVEFDLDTLTVTGNAMPLVPEVRRANARQTGVAQYGISNDGTLVYLRGELTAAENSVVWVDREGREQPVAVPPGAYDYPRISPDGTRVLLDDGPSENGFDIWNFSTGILTRLSSDGRGTAFPIWTPDSARVVYASVSGTFGLESRAANSTGTIDTLAPAVINDIRIPYFFAPDTNALVFSSTESSSRDADIGMMTFGSEIEIDWLIVESLRELNADLRQDGDWIAYQSNQSGRDEIYVRPFPDTEGDRVPVSNAGGVMPLWSRDGNELFYLEGSPIGSTDRLMRVEATVTDGVISFTAPEPVLDPWLFLGTYAATERTYDVSPDGQRFLAIRNIGVTDIDAEIVVVLNFVDDMQRQLAAN